MSDFGPVPDITTLNVQAWAALSEREQEAALRAQKESPVDLSSYTTEELEVVGNFFWERARDIEEEENEYDVYGYLMELSRLVDFQWTNR